MSNNDNEEQEKPEQNSNYNNEEEKKVDRNEEDEVDQNPENNENPEEIKENEEGENPSPPEEKNPFYYFEEINNEIKDDSIFEGDKGKYKYSICILMKNDLMESSQSLYYTLKGVEQNLKNLKEKIKINSEQIIIFIFVNCLYGEYLFKYDDLNKLEEMKENNINNSNNNITNNNNTFDLLMRERTFKEDNELKNIKFYTIGNNFENVLFDIRALKTYYSFLDKLMNNFMFSSVITAGVYPTNDSLISLIQYSYDNDKNHGVSIAPIEYKPNGLFSKISLYEKIHFNIFNMNYYFESRVVPISSLLCTMALDDNLLKFLNNYYEKDIYINASIDYHDYNLGLKLITAENRKYMIKYNYDRAYGIIDKEMSFFDYQKDFVNRYSGYYGNFFEILRAFIDFNTCKATEKIFLFFQILAIATEFVFPSLACMVIYTIFLEAFNSTDYRIALFFTSFYLCMMLASGICSLITKEPAKMKITNYFLYFFMNIFYLLVIVCSVPAIHFARTKVEYDYKFNKLAISFIIVFTFIPYIIPFILNISIIGNNIVNMLLYLLLGAPSSTSNFNMAKVWNAPDTAGGTKIEFRKAVHIIIYLCFNLFIGCLSFYNTDLTKKANCVMALGIMFLVYNFFRTIAIIIKITCHKEESFDNKNLFKKIDTRINKEGEQNDNKDENDNDNNENQYNNSNYNNNQNNDSINNDENNNRNNENDDNNN